MSKAMFSPQGVLGQQCTEALLVSTLFIMCSLGSNVVESVSAYAGEAVAPFVLSLMAIWEDVKTPILAHNIFCV